MLNPNTPQPSIMQKLIKIVSRGVFGMKSPKPTVIIVADAQ